MVLLSVNDSIEIVIQDGVRSIGEYTFYGTERIDGRIVLPESVTSIGERAFQYCRMESMIIKGSECHIDGYAFHGCPYLKSVTFSDDSVELVMEEYAFAYCENLEYFGFPAGTASIGNSAFAYTRLTSANLPELVSLGTGAFENCQRLASIILSESLVSIGDRAFSQCISLQSLTIPLSVESLGEGAFYDCYSIENLVIPTDIDAVVSTSNPVFGNCGGIRQVEFTKRGDGLHVYDAEEMEHVPWRSAQEVTIPGGITSIFDSYFAECTSLKTVHMPSGLVSIGCGAFRGCSFEWVDLPDSVYYIGAGAFQGCSSLRSISLPDEVGAIGESTFQGCSSLVSVTIPDSVFSIEASAFQGCRSLKSASIPTSVNSIGEGAFYGCTGLRSLSIPTDLDAVVSSSYPVFEDCKGITDVTFIMRGSGLLEYDAESHWSVPWRFAGNVSIPEGVESIPDAYFASFISLRTVSLPSSLESIGDSAFEECTALGSIAIPDSVNSIGSYAFYKCSSLVDVRLPASLASIGERIFEECVGLSEVSMPSSLESIGERAFRGCTSLVSLHIAGSPEHIGDRAFEDCSALASVSIDGRAGVIGRSAFAGCTGLRTLYIPMGAEIVGSYAFFGCDGVTDIVIGSDALLNCFSFVSGDGPLNASLRTAVVCGDVESIGKWRFVYCTNLEAVSLPDTLRSIGDAAFGTCSKLSKITFPKGDFTIAESAFRYPFADDPHSGGLFELDPVAKVYRKATEYAQVSFDCGGIAPDPDAQHVEVGHHAIRPADPVAEGHMFAGWYTEPEFVKEWDFEADEVMWSMTLYAKWYGEVRTITFDTGAGSRIEPVSVRAGAPIPDVGDPVRTGYAFTGWDPALPKVMPDEDIRTVAVWNPITYAVDFSSNGGTGIMGYQTFTYDVPQALSPNVFAYEGHTFRAWSDSPTGDGRVFADREEVSNLRDSPGVVALYALWDDVVCTVSFDSAGGTDVPPARVAWGSLIAEPTPPTKSGHAFAGWFADAGCTDGWDFDSDTVTEDFTMHAKWVANAHRITFDSRGGSAVESLVLPFGADIPQIGDPVRTGYSFAGWEPALPATMPDRDLEVSAVWAPITYSVVFNANGGSGSMESQTFEYDATQRLRANTFEQTGYVFRSWSTSPTGDGRLFADREAVSNLADTQDATVRLFAIWGDAVCTVEFDSMGGTDVPPVTVAWGSPIAEPTPPAKAGHSFAGWFSDRGLTERWDFAEDRVEGDMMLHAKWIINRYTISFRDTSGIHIDPITLDYGAEVPVIDPPTPTGYELRFWLPALPETMPDHDMEVVAVWTPVEYTVRFDANGGAGAMPDQGFKYDGAQKLRANAFSRDGFGFAGWNTSADGSGDAYSDRERVWNLSSEEGAVVTLHAQWADEFHTVTFDAHNGAEPVDVTVAHGSAVAEPADPTRGGFHFTGWYGDAGCDVRWNFAEDRVVSDITLHAGWTQILHTVTFDSHGGTSVPSAVVASGSLVDEPPEPAKTGHAFAGWYRDASYTVRWDFGSDVVESAITLHARWEAITWYTITFLTGGGTAVEPLTLAFGEDVPDVDDPSRTGYSFGGWAPALPATMPDRDLEVAAAWNPITYTVSFEATGGRGVMADQGFAYDAAQPLSPNAFEYTGHSFRAWCTSPDGDGRLFTDGEEVLNLADSQGSVIVLYALWDDAVFTVTFRSTGGSYVAPQSVVNGSLATEPPAPWRAGYLFDGWFDEEDDAEWDFYSDRVVSNITLYAKWWAEEHTIFFETDGGTEIPPITADTGEPITAPADPVKRGYAFFGWDDDLPREMPPYDLVLTAEWTPVQYTVVFDANGGAGSMMSQPFAYGIPQALSPNAFAYEGHTFRAWSTSPTGDGMVFADRETVSNLRDTYGIVVLYALWDDAICTVSFDSAGGTAVPSASVAWGSTVGRPADPVRKGYALAGWFADDDLTDEWDFETDAVSGDMVLHAKWDAVRYAIVYVLNGGEDPGNPSWYTVESGDIVLEDASRDGSVFCGWYLDPGFTQQVKSIPSGSAGDIVLYARWMPDPKVEDAGLALGAVIAVMVMAFASLIVTRRR